MAGAPHDARPARPARPRRKGVRCKVSSCRWRRGHCIDALHNSSCATADGSNVTAGGMIWAGIALGLSVLALVFASVAVRRRRGP